MSEDGLKVTVSRQRKWQWKKQKEGNCVICGEPRVNTKHCEFHRKDHAIRSRNAYRLKNLIAKENYRI